VHRPIGNADPHVASAQESVTRARPQRDTKGPACEELIAGVRSTVDGAYSLPGAEEEDRSERTTGQAARSAKRSAALVLVAVSNSLKVASISA
jgi:hypothetical protein